MNVLLVLLLSFRLKCKWFPWMAFCLIECLPSAFKATFQKKRVVLLHWLILHLQKEISFYRAFPIWQKITLGCWIIKELPLLWRHVLAYLYTSWSATEWISSHLLESATKTRLIFLIGNDCVLFSVADFDLTVWMYINLIYTAHVPIVF